MRKFAKPKLSPFVGSVAILVRGTVLAQIAMVVATPFLVRMYGIENWGLYGVFYSIFYLLASSVALRYEQAIPIAGDSETATHALRLSMLSTTVFALVVFVASLLFGATMDSWVGGHWLATHPWLLPVVLIGGGIYQTFSYWAIRIKDFGAISHTTAAQAFAMVATQLGLHFVFPTSAFPLPLGLFIGRTAGSSRLYKCYLDTSRKIPLSMANMMSVAKRYSRFPLLSLPASLANSAGLQLPTLALAGVFGKVEAGQFFTSIRMLAIPMVFIGGAINQVFLSEFGRLAREDRTKLKPLFARTVRRLIPIAILLLLFGLSAPLWFEAIFGPNTYTAGVWTAVMSPSVALGLVVSPVSVVSNVLEKQGWQFLLDVVRLIATIVVFFSPKWYAVTPQDAVIGYGVTMFLVYGLSLWVYYRLVAQASVPSHDV